MVRKGLLFIGL